MQLSDKLTGDPLKFINKQKRGEGLAAWRELINWYDSRTHVDKSAAFAKTVAPQPRSKDINQTVDMMNAWEQLVSNYEARHGMIDDISKITGLKQIVPEDIIDHHFRGRVYNIYKLFRQDVSNYLNDRNRARKESNANMGIDAVVETLKGAAPAEDIEGDSRDQPAEELGAKLLAALGLKGKSSSKGHHGYGPLGKGAQGYGPQWPSRPNQVWNSGWPSSGGKQAYKGDWSKGNGFGKFGGTPTKGSDDRYSKGKGKGKASLQCFNCGGKGHKAAACASDRVNSLEDSEPQVHEDDAAGFQDIRYLGEIMKDTIAVCSGREGEEHDDNDDDEGFIEIKSKKTRKKMRKSSNEVKEVCVIKETKGKWACIETGVDSCAADNVCPVTMFPDITTVESEA